MWYWGEKGNKIFWFEKTPMVMPYWLDLMALKQLKPSRWNFL